MSLYSILQIEQFLVITWGKKSVKAKHMIAEGYIPKMGPCPTWQGDSTLPDREQASNPASAR
jgi:hypothetical protein